MSDTTTTITPKTKTILRDMQGCAMGWVPGTRLLGNSRAGEICTAIDQVLTALEAAEAALLKEEVYSEELESQLQHAREENERLRAERDWLAGSMAEDGCPYLAFWADLEEDMRPDWCICTDTADDGFDCTGDPKECWQQEAARRAVAAGEGE